MWNEVVVAYFKLIPSYLKKGFWDKIFNNLGWVPFGLQSNCVQSTSVITEPTGSQKIVHYNRG
jgi:hypothetical protein